MKTKFFVLDAEQTVYSNSNDNDGPVSVPLACVSSHNYSPEMERNETMEACEVIAGGEPSTNRPPTAVEVELLLCPTVR